MFPIPGWRSLCIFTYAATVQYSDIVVNNVKIAQYNPKEILHAGKVRYSL